MDLQHNIATTVNATQQGVVRSAGQADRQDTKPVEARRDPDGKDGSRSEAAQSLDMEGVKRMLDDASQKLQTYGVELHFKLNKDAGGVQVEVRDSKTDKVIRKIPEDDLLRLASHIKDFNGDLAGALAGTLVDRPI